MSKPVFYKKSKISKALLIHNQAVLVNSVKNEIDIFGGSRSNARYKDLQKVLATTSIKIQDLKVKTHKQHNRDYCEEIQTQIQHCFRRLESKASFNAKNDNTYMSFAEDLELPELTHDDIAVGENCECGWQLAELEEECERLEGQLKNFEELGDIKQLSYLEKQIRLLYRQLDDVSVKNLTPHGDKKLTLAKKLVKCNNQLKKAKRNISRKTKSYLRFSFSKKDDISLNVEEQLSEIESSTQSFDGVVGDKSYLELQQSMEWQKINLHKISSEDLESKHRNSSMLEKVDYLMKDLKRKAEANENRLSTETLCDTNTQLIQRVDTFKSIWNKLDESLSDSGYCNGIANVLESISEEVDDAIVRLRFLLSFENINNDAVDSKKFSHNLDSYNGRIVKDKNEDSIFEMENSKAQCNSEQTDYIEMISSKGYLVNQEEHTENEVKDHGPSNQFQTDKSSRAKPHLQLLPELPPLSFEQDYRTLEIRTNSPVVTEIQEYFVEDHQQKQMETQKSLASPYELFNSNTTARHSLDESDEIALDYNQYEEEDENNNPKIINEILEQCRKDVESTEQSINSSRVSDPFIELEILQDKITRIKLAISEISASSPKDKIYQIISDALKSCASEMNDIDEGNVALIREQKRNLSGELSNCETLLRNKFENRNTHHKELQNIRKVLERLSDAEIQINAFTGCRSDKTYSELDELLVTLMVQLNNVRTYNDDILEAEKGKVMQAILKNVRILSNRVTENSETML